MHRNNYLESKYLPGADQTRDNGRKIGSISVSGQLSTYPSPKACSKRRATAVPNLNEFGSAVARR